ncbi:MAG: DUF899 family protein [Candidatus Aenigmarchaeota archaeon]|nr:DUF899 family protein [Candidatus Aenigmarchaeota archaeon]
MSAKKMEVKDYQFRDWNNKTIGLSGLFGSKEELILIHNMGKSCSYCTMWADGFNGVLHHLEDRASFVVVSPDSPKVQKAFAKGRGWKFRMVSAEGSPFSREMGFESDDGEPCPGVSVFQKRGRNMHRVSHDKFGPGDSYCLVWHLFSLLPEGSKDWEPKFEYK